jgi:hypothetical protein
MVLPPVGPPVPAAGPAGRGANRSPPHYRRATDGANLFLRPPRTPGRPCGGGAALWWRRRARAPRRPPVRGPVGRKESAALCRLALFFRAVPDAPVVGANREERHARPGDRPRLVAEPVRFVVGVDPGGRPKVRFYWRAEPRVLPAWHEGRLQLLLWGNRRGECRSLPVTGWASQQKAEGGGWAGWRPEPVLVPATAAGNPVAAAGGGRYSAAGQCSGDSPRGLSPFVGGCPGVSPRRHGHGS